MDKINIILPVYRGGDYFRECLASIVPHIDIVKCLYISINKSISQKEDIESAQEFIDKYTDLTVKIYIRNRELTAKNHGYALLNDIMPVISAEYVMFLCHDDILLPSFSSEILPLLKNFCSDSSIVINPAREFYFESFTKENLRYTFYGLKLFPEGLDICQFISNDIDRHYITNISGIVFSRQCLTEYSKISKMLRYGYRAEYLLLASKTNTRIISTHVPVIGIREHSQQQGAINKPIARFIDDSIYFLYVYITRKDELLKNKLEKKILIIKLYKRPFYMVSRFIYRRIKKILNIG